MKRMTGWALALALALVAFGGVQAGNAGGELRIENTWARATPAVAPVAAGYLTVVNDGDTADRLLRIDSAIAQRIEMHQTVHEDGVMRMRRVPRLVLDAGGAAHLKPGGLHLMLFRPAAALGEGDTATIVFRHEGKDVAQGQFTVRAPE